jgi:hypothetical protein
VTITFIENADIPVISQKSPRCPPIDRFRDLPPRPELLEQNLFRPDVANFISLRELRHDRLLGNRSNKRSTEIDCRL